jgi:hypothetical protein
MGDYREAVRRFEAGLDPVPSGSIATALGAR